MSSINQEKDGFSSFQKLVAVIGIAVVTLIGDQFTKSLITRGLSLNDQIPAIDGIFNIVLVYNKGTAFGLFSGLDDGIRQIVIAALTGLALVVVVFLLRNDYIHSQNGRTALGLILGGAIGNIIDRVRLGHVVDFLDFFYRDYHWPAFNVADSAIVVGVAILVLTGSGKKPAVAES